MHMVIYEVNLTIEPSIAEAFAAWLGGHVEAILRLDGFVRAAWYRREAEAGETGVLITVHYSLESRGALEAYFEHHAPAMRADGLERFGGAFKASRRVMVLERSFG